MKPTLELDVKHVGNFNGEKQSMTLDANSIQYLIGTLTDLYSDKAMAVIREYSTNARDANDEAGNTAPIKATLPTMLDPNFTVEDEGVGLDEEEIFSIYAKYGASTKRDSDDVVGMLGLGCKSALTYTNIFTLVCRKNGVEIVVIVTRDEHGVGSVQVEERNSTTKPNGVKVVVPVRDVHSFEEKANWFYSFWRPGTVLVNGTEPEGQPGQWIDPDVLIVDVGNRYNRRDYVVMGNVPYPITNQDYGVLTNGAVVAYVPIGAVNFTPSREALHFTPRTKDTLETIKTFLQERLWVMAQKEVDEAENATEAVNLADKWRALLHYRYRKDLTYRGMTVPGAIRLPPGGWQYSISHNSASKIQMYDTFHPVSSYNQIFITGHQTKTVTSAQRRKLQVWQKGDSNNAHNVILVNGMDFYEPWSKNLPAVHWEEIEKIEAPAELKPPKQKAAAPTDPKPTWLILTEQSYPRKVGTIPTDKPILLLSPSVTSEQYVYRYTEAFGDRYTLLLLHPNSWPKFSREWDGPHPVIELEEARRLEMEWLKKMMRPIMVPLLKERGVRWPLPTEDYKKILDPKLRMYCLAYRIAEKYNLVTKYKGLSRSAAFPLDVYPSDAADRELYKIKNAYPLMFANPRSKEHNVEYVNALYTYRTKEKS